MRIGLLGCGGDSWMGGAYYLVNLVRALSALPEEERPEVVLVLPPGVDKRHFDEIADQVAFIEAGSLGSSWLSRAQAWGPGFRRLLMRSVFRLEAVRSLRRHAELEFFVQLAPLLSKASVDMLFPCLDALPDEYPIPWVPWAWDFQHKYYPAFFTVGQLRERDEVFNRMRCSGRRVVVSSQNALEDFDRFFPGCRENLRVLHFCSVPREDWFSGDPCGVRRKYGLPQEFFLVSNQFWEHKNHAVVLDAVRMLRERGRSIVIACTGQTKNTHQPDYMPRLEALRRKHHLEEYIRVLGLIPRLDQVQLMRCCQAVVQPSLFEGWSTVVEDARALGRPLLVSNLPVHREQAHPRAVYFDPRSAEELAEHLVQAMEWSPGPASDEVAHLTAHGARMIGYARSFIRLATEQMQCHRPQR